MLKTRIYILQFLGVILLLCGYFLSDQPDSLSIMHFDPNPACPSVISKAQKSFEKRTAAVTSITHNNTSRKLKEPRYTVYEVLMPQNEGYTFHPFGLSFEYSFGLSDRYRYLFYKEINPPPPRFC